ncbi:MAG: acylphosphatase [candidate division WOR-3 bacterium]|nr:MAG: acylphosphatase [candidate division WOR-3 bacterium]
MGECVRVRMIIWGVVQGVFFRANTVEKARSLNLSGWVRNLPDGSVEVVAEGPRDTLVDLVRWCHRGPVEARVDTVDIEWQSAIGERGFEIH